jgi:tetratricopeptide (TPR) repeat protein
MRTKRALSSVLCAAFVAFAWPGAALAKGPDAAAAPDAATKAKAAKKFKEGERAFKRHDYTAAAAAFDEAYSIAPHPAALFNAATAYEKAGELTRAANLCARYLRDAPEDDSRREKANALIGDLTPKLGRIQIQERGASDVTLDGKDVEDEVSYVNPGDHVVTGRFGEKGVERKFSVVAGSLLRVVLEPPKKKVETGLSEEGAGSADGEPAEKDRDKEKPKPLPPAVFYAGAAITVVLGGVAVWSGLDTNKARSDYDSSPTQDGLDAGKSKQSRTNLLLVASGVALGGTAVIGLFFTDWKHGPKEKPPPPEAKLLIGPGFIGASGRF